MLRTSFPTSLNRNRPSTILKDENSSLTTVNDLYEKDLIVYGTTWVAWIQIFNVVLVNSASSLMWASASSAPVVVSEWMQVNYTALNWLSNLSAVINTICSLLTGWSYQRFGIKANVIQHQRQNKTKKPTKKPTKKKPANYRFCLQLS